MAVVILAEKPSVAKDLAKALGATAKQDYCWSGDELRITWAIGHLLEYKQPDEYDKKYTKWKMADLPIFPDEFEVRPYKGRGSNSKQLTEIIKLFRNNDVDEIVNACDAAREGELIFHRIIEHADVDVPVTRMWMQSMTKDAIIRAWENRTPSANFDTLRNAAISRAESDWLIGINGTRATTSRLKPRSQKGSLSIGRVQTATLAILCERETQILSHIPESYWELKAIIDAPDGTWEAKWTRSPNKGESKEPTEISNSPHRIFDVNEKENIENALLDDNIANLVVSRKNRVEKSPLLFNLINLQRIANRLWSWPTKKLDNVAQELYEKHKLITYPRTDSQYLTDDMKAHVTELISALGKQNDYGTYSELLKFRSRWDKP